MATYENIATGETYKMGGVKNMEQAWDLAEFVCRRNDWNLETFALDVKVTFK